MNWIQSNTFFKGELVERFPLEEKHFEDLAFLAKEKKNWEFIPIDMGSTEKCSQVFANAIIEKEKRTQFPFVIFHKPENTIIGSTRLMNIEAEHKTFDTTIIHANAAVEFAISPKSN